MRKHVSTLHDGNGGELVVPYHPNNNLPIMFTSTNQTVDGINITQPIKSFNTSDIFTSVANKTNQNLTASQKELLVWHWKINHIGFQWLQTLMITPISNAKSDEQLLPKHTMIQCQHTGSKICNAPMCAACCLSNMSCRHADIKTSSSQRTSNIQKLKENHLQPGDCVSLDQCESSTRGRLPNTKGQEARSKKNVTAL